MFGTVLQKTAFSALGAVLGATAASIGPTALGLVPTASASPATAELDVTMTAGYACPLSCGSPSNTLFAIKWCRLLGGDILQAILRRPGPRYVEGL